MKFRGDSTPKERTVLRWIQSYVKKAAEHGYPENDARSFFDYYSFSDVAGQYHFWDYTQATKEERVVMDQIRRSRRVKVGQVTAKWPARSPFTTYTLFRTSHGLTIEVTFSVTFSRARFHLEFYRGER